MDYGRNPYQDIAAPAKPPAIGRLTQAVIALLFALAAIYLAS
jgi:hypothetical protein